MVGTLFRRPEASRGVLEGIEARVLGGFDVSAGGRHLARADWQRTSAERLVKLLLVTPGHAISREAAAETLWPGTDPEAGRASLRKALHFAGRALGAAVDLTSRTGWVALEAATLDLDLDRLRAAFDMLGAQPPRMGGEVEQAIAVVLELGPRELLPDDVYEEWLTAPRERLQAQWQRVALVAGRRAFEIGRPDQARSIADQLLDRDPTDEAAHRLVIEILAAEGRHHLARRQFDMCRRALRELLDVEPSRETVETFATSERAAMSAVGVSTTPRLVARHAELERIESLLDRVAAKRLAALVIHGPTGIGKSRLLHEVAGYGRAAGWRVLEWQAIEAASAPAYGPIGGELADGLGARLVDSWSEPARSGMAAVAPGLGLQGTITFADRAALLEALACALAEAARERPLLLAIDDAPWLDASTLELLERVVANPAHVPILVAATSRDDEPAPEPAQRFLEQARRAKGLDLALGPLGPSDIEPLIVGHLGGASVQSELARRAFELSDGNPLFCLELVRAGWDRGRVRLVGDRWSVVRYGPPAGGRGSAGAAAAGDRALAPEDMPESVRRLVANRSARLSGPPLELVETAAELGALIPYASLQAILGGLDGGLIPALDAVLASGLMVERGGGYAFAHPLYRLAVRGTSGSARRAGTRLAVALALAGCRGDELPAELERRAATCADPQAAAEHALTACELGAAAALPVAVAFGFAASERAVRLFDPGARSLLERSLAAWEQLPPGRAHAFDASGAYARLANIQMYRGGGDAAARANFHEAISAARTPEELARAYTDYYWLPYRRGDFEGGLAIVEEALLRLPADAAVARANVQRWVGWTLGRLHRLDESIEQLGDAVRVLEASADRQGEMSALDQLGTMLQLAGRLDEAIERLERSLTLALALRDPKGEIVRTHLGTALTHSGYPGRARPHLERALEITHQMGDRYLESVTAWAVAEMEDALGNYRAAKEMRVRELALLSSIGGNPHNEALSHAHLAHLARLNGDEATVEAEAAEARRLAVASPAPGYPARIEAALSVERWADLETP